MLHTAPPADYTPLLTDIGSEMPFDVKDLVYSRTDGRGVIQSANDTFQRLSGYEWDELFGAPHKIVRHPDMPKGFFHLFWSLLQKGEPAVGYVKNRTKDGRNYWVLASAIPCEGGHFSVRMKATSEFFGTIRAEYARHLRREQDEELSAEASSALLLERIGELGFASYAELMSYALHAETASRNAALRRPVDENADKLMMLVKALNAAVSEQNRLLALFANLQLLPVNMRLVAARLEPLGGPISQISMNYKISFDEIATRLQSFVTGDNNLCARMEASVRRNLILTACSHLHREAAKTIDRTTGGLEPAERRREHLVLRAMSAASLAKAAASLEEAGKTVINLMNSAAETRRMILGLDTIRILGRVESRRDAASEAAFSATLDRIDMVQAEISASLRNLSNAAGSIQAMLAAIKPVAADGSAA